MTCLENKTVVVTGASAGIGRAIARTCAQAGARVVVNYHSSGDQARELVALIESGGGKALAVGADVSRPGDVRRLVDEACNWLGQVDVWVNNAGADILTGDGARLDDDAKLERLLAVDLRGTIDCCWAIAPLMKERGSGCILNMAWDMAIHGFPGRNPQMFAAVKAGVIGFSRALARDLAPAVRVNVLAPGWIRTAFADENMDPDYRDARLAEIPMGRFGTVEDVAAAAVYLASDEASYVTGQILNINGGQV